MDTDAPLCQLHSLLRQRLPQADVAADYVRHLRSGRGTSVAAIVYYGSHLWGETRTRSSVPDFYVVVDSLQRYHGPRWIDAAVNSFLPPNAYYRTFTEGSEPPLTCKYCVISRGQLRAETAVNAADVHHIGRFSKRVAIVWWRDDTARDAVIAASASAMRAVTAHALTLVGPRFTLEELVMAALGLSYLAERRLREPHKVANLLRAERDFYFEAYALALASHAAAGGAVTRRADGATYEQPAPDAAARRRTQRFLERSRWREKARWPKYLVTFDNWLDYLLDKVERHSGTRLDLTPRQRRYPLIFGWPLYFDLRRRGVIR